MEAVIARNTEDLERLEGIIKTNIGAFYEVGRALMEIRDKGLYKDVLGFDTFEAYCKERWDMSKRHAYRLMDSFKVIDTVKSDQLVTPQTESQARPLARLEPDQQREAWKQAVETAPEGKVTAAHVYKIVRDMTEPVTKPEKPKPEPHIPEHAVYFAQIAISQLERISADDPTREKAINMVQAWINKNKTGKEKGQNDGSKG
jgi:hypothetical protein